MVTIATYEPTFESDWNAFVKGSRNGTFILQRPYMDYHRDRFKDASIIARDGDRVLALLPAHRLDDEIHSHHGLTYGGFVIQDTMTTPRMLEIFQDTLNYFGAQGVRRLSYAPVPHIYHRNPSEEDLFALFKLGARVTQRQVLSVIDLSAPLAWQIRRRRGVKRAEKSGFTAGQSEDWYTFWRLLGLQLEQRYKSTPVHSLEEITLLQRKFPNNIKLYSCSNAKGEMQAGVVIYESKRVSRTQYIASSEIGRESGAIDLLFSDLLNVIYADKQYFDLGSSNGVDDYGISLGLVAQKEGFGARTIIQDQYELEIE